MSNSAMRLKSSMSSFQRVGDTIKRKIVEVLVAAITLSTFMRHLPPSAAEERGNWDTAPDPSQGAAAPCIPAGAK